MTGAGVDLAARIVLTVVGEAVDDGVVAIPAVPARLTAARGN
jgi:hypothetical protein